MRKLLYTSKPLFYGLILGFLFISISSYGQIREASDSLPPIFLDNYPPDMEMWYDNNISNGEIRLDVRSSTSNWKPFTPSDPPKDAPNILFILYDDTGLGAWSPYGGGIKMPTLDSLAAAGLTYTQWHTTALCSPTRSTILTGRNHHLKWDGLHYRNGRWISGV